MLEAADKDFKNVRTLTQRGNFISLSYGDVGGDQMSGAKSFKIRHFLLSLKSLAVLLLLRCIFQSRCFLEVVF